MGATLPRRSLTLPLNLPDYEEVQDRSSASRSAEKPYRLLRNIHTGFEVHQYQMCFESESQFNRYFEAFEWRLSQPFIVNTVYFSENIRREFCSTSYGGTLYTEHIPLKLSEIKDIPSPDNLYILLSALDGFSIIYARIGFFNVEECMICINKQGKARVWVSDDLSRITPDADEILFHGTQRDLVRRVVELLDNNTDTSTQPASVQSYFNNENNPNPNFVEARNMIKQMARQHKIRIPTSFDCILDILNSDNAQITERVSHDDRLSVSRSHRVNQEKQSKRKNHRHPHQSIRESSNEEQFSRGQSKNNQRIVLPAQQHKVMIIRQPQTQLHRMVKFQVGPKDNLIPSNFHIGPTVRYNNSQPINIIRHEANDFSHQIQGLPYRGQSSSSRQNYHVGLHQRHRPAIRSMGPYLHSISPANYVHNTRQSAVKEQRHPNVKNYTGMHRDTRRKEDDGYISDSSNFKQSRIEDKGRSYESSVEGDRNNNQFRQKQHQQLMPEKINFTKKLIKHTRIQDFSKDEKNISKLIKMNIEDLSSSNRFNERVNVVNGNSLRQPSLTMSTNPLMKYSGGPSQPTLLNTNLINSFNRNILDSQETVNANVTDKRQLLDRKTKISQAISVTRETIKHAQLANSPRINDRNKEELTAQARKYYASKYDHSLDPQIALDLMQMGL